MLSSFIYFLWEEAGMGVYVVLVVGVIYGLFVFGGEHNIC